jgi:PrtD family type I secretion system ABC transporter
MLLDDCERQLRRQGFTLAVFSLAANLLLLVSSIYMLQVFDRVLSSGSLDTLLWLTVAAVSATVTYGIVEFSRRRLLALAGEWLENRLSAPVIRAGVGARLTGSRSEAGLSDVRDLRAFLGGDAILAFLDAPWMLIFIAVIWMMHPVLGWLALVGAVVLFALALVNDLLTRRRQQTAGAAQRRNQQAAQQYLEQAETVQALGMLGPLLRRWQSEQQRSGAMAQRAGAVTDGLLNVTRVLRLALQILILGIGASLVLRGELTGGGMIAASIILSRALSPVERALGAWRSFVSARAARANLEALFAGRSEDHAGLQLPAPQGHLVLEDVTYLPSAAKEPTLARVAFELAAGEACGIIGPSGSGKSTLCRLIVGAWKPSRGHVRLDGADVASWDVDELGRHVGYLPQEVVLFPGTIAENIARMGEIDDAKVIAAARLADVHEMILHLPKGYDTLVGPLGHRLAGGQKQRIGLARALFGDPSLVVLDEPNASLDSAGEAALQAALLGLRERRRTVLVVAHQANVLRNMDKVLLLKEGQVTMFGERDKVLQSLMRRPPAQIAEPQRQLAGSPPNLIGQA